ncbi:MAG: DNA topoisomerase, partial [Sulfobacillus sp.]
MKLIIAEKPSVARDIASVLGSVQRREGYLEANGYTVTYAVGHLVGLADADAYDSKYKTWKLQDLPILPE